MIKIIFNNPKASFRNKHIYKEKYDEELEDKWFILKRVQAFHENSRNCKLCLEEKYKVFRIRVIYEIRN